MLVKLCNFLPEISKSNIFKLTAIPQVACPSKLRTPNSLARTKKDCFIQNLIRSRPGKCSAHENHWVKVQWTKHKATHDSLRLWSSKNFRLFVFDRKINRFCRKSAAKAHQREYSIRLPCLAESSRVLSRTNESGWTWTSREKLISFNQVNEQ